MSYYLRFCYLNNSCSWRSINFNVLELRSNNFLFQRQTTMTDVSVTVRSPCLCTETWRLHTKLYKFEWNTFRLTHKLKPRRPKSFICQLFYLIVYIMVTILFLMTWRWHCKPATREYVFSQNHLYTVVLFYDPVIVSINTTAKRSIRAFLLSNCETYSWQQFTGIIIHSARYLFSDWPKASREYYFLY